MGEQIANSASRCAPVKRVGVIATGVRHRYFRRLNLDQNTHPAPFNLGDHLCYVGSPQWRALSVEPKGSAELVLAPGMVGVVILSSGALAGIGTGASQPWRCQAQFHNGLQRDITPYNRSDFAVPQRGNHRTVIEPLRPALDKTLTGISHEPPDRSSSEAPEQNWAPE